MTALLLAGTIIAGVFIPWAVRNDRADAHLQHTPGTCVECDAK